MRTSGACEPPLDLNQPVESRCGRGLLHTRAQAKAQVRDLATGSVEDKVKDTANDLVHGMSTGRTQCMYARLPGTR